MKFHVVADVDRIEADGIAVAVSEEPPTHSGHPTASVASRGQDNVVVTMMSAIPAPNIWKRQIAPSAYVVVWPVEAEGDRDLLACSHRRRCRGDRQVVAGGGRVDEDVIAERAARPVAGATVKVVADGGRARCRCHCRTKRRCRRRW